jgi:SAM-dependent methyltransferase
MKFTKEENAQFWEAAQARSDKNWVTDDTLRHICGLHNVSMVYEATASLNVLEIGVGLGAATKELHKLNHIVTAVDISPTALSRVASFCKATHLTPAMVDIPSDSIDFAMCSNVFIHCDDEMVGFISEQVARVLRDGGRFMCDTSNVPHPISEPNRDESLSRGTHNYRTRDRLIQLVCESGLSFASSSAAEHHSTAEGELDAYYIDFIKKDIGERFV